MSMPKRGHRQFNPKNLNPIHKQIDGAIETEGINLLTVVKRSRTTLILRMIIINLNQSGSANPPKETKGKMIPNTHGAEMSQRNHKKKTKARLKKLRNSYQISAYQGLLPTTTRLEIRTMVIIITQ